MAIGKAKSSLASKNGVTCIGSTQRELTPLSKALASLGNAGGLLADGASLLYSTNDPAEPAAVGGILVQQADYFLIKREPTKMLGLKFSLGDPADASAKTAQVRIIGLRPVLVNGLYEYVGEHLATVTLTAGTQNDSGILRPAINPAALTSLKLVSSMVINVDSTYGSSAKVCSAVLNGHALLLLDTQSCPLVLIHGNNISSSAITGVYTEM